MSSIAQAIAPAVVVARHEQHQHVGLGLCVGRRVPLGVSRVQHVVEDVRRGGRSTPRPCALATYAWIQASAFPHPRPSERSTLSRRATAAYAGCRPCRSASSECRLIRAGRQAEQRLGDDRERDRLDERPQRDGLAVRARVETVEHGRAHLLGPGPQRLARSCGPSRPRSLPVLVTHQAEHRARAERAREPRVRAAVVERGVRRREIWWRSSGSENTT